MSAYIVELSRSIAGNSPEYICPGKRNNFHSARNKSGKHNSSNLSSQSQVIEIKTFLHYTGTSHQIFSYVDNSKITDVYGSSGVK